MAIKIGSIGTDFSSVARNYALSNQSSVSSVYEQQKVNSTAAAKNVGSVSPVQYPNADLQAKQVEKAAESIKTEQAFNQVAASYQNMAAAYTADGTAEAYGMTGSIINTMA